MPRPGLVLVALTRRPKGGLALALVATMALTTGMAAAQSFTEYTIPTADSGPQGITAGPDGNIWFTTGNKIGKVTTTGTVTEYTANSVPLAEFPPIAIDLRRSPCLHSFGVVLRSRCC